MSEYKKAQMSAGLVLLPRDQDTARLDLASVLPHLLLLVGVAPDLNVVFLHVAVDLLALLLQLLLESLDQLAHLVSVARQCGHHVFDSPLDKNTAHHSKTLSIASNTVESLDHNLMFVQVLLEFVLFTNGGRCSCREDCQRR